MRKCHGQEPAKNKKGENMSYLPKKTNKKCTKVLQKIRQARDAHIISKTQKSKQENKQAIAHNTHENRMQNAIVEQSKKMQH